MKYKCDEQPGERSLLEGKLIQRDWSEVARIDFPFLANRQVL